MYFLTYGHPTTWMDKCLKSPVSDDPSTSNMLNGTKHFSKPKFTIFATFIDPCEYNKRLKSLS